MKKITLSLVVLALGLTITSTAQQSKNVDFKPGLFMGLNGGVNLFAGEGNNFLVKGANNNWSLDQSMGYLGRLELGYHFSPVYSLRGMIGVNDYNYYTKINNVESVSSFNSQNLTADFMMNLTNLAKGYDADRKFTVSAFAGLGIAYMNDNVVASKIGGSLLRGGFQGNLHLTPQWALNLIADVNFLSDNNNDQTAGLFFDGSPALTLGFNYSFASQDNTPIVEEKLPMKDNVVVETEKEAPVVVEKKEEKKVVVPVVTDKKVVVPTLTENMYYELGKSDLVTDEQKAAVAKVAAYMKANTTVKVVLNGYADRETGTDAVNNALSRRRAEKVAKALTKQYDIDKNRISVKWFGSQVQPYAKAEQNRVVIVMSEPAK